MKKLGYVLAEFPVLSETFVGNEMRAMRLLGHPIVPIACRRPSGASQPDDMLLASHTRYLTDVALKDVLLCCLRHPWGAIRTYWAARQQQGLRPRSAWLMAAKIAVQADKAGCEHLHAHFALHSAAGAILAARWLGITASFVGHGYDVYATPADLPLKLVQADFSVAVCQQMQLDFQSMAPQARVTLVPCGIELDKFQFQPHAQPSNHLLFIGRLTEKKGVFHLLHALAAISPAQRPCLDIVGDGELKSAIEGEIAKLQLQSYVQLLGAKTSDWIRSHAGAYAGLVAPFQVAENGDRDTGPLVLKEAMALGLPVISSRLMGCIEIVDENSGFLVPPADRQALTAAILELLALTANDRMQLALQARHKIEHRFNVLQLCRKLSDQIGALV